MACRMIAYYRVSTEKQGRSGLGLDGQRAAVDAFVASAGCELVATYTEVETAKRQRIENRPELQRAIAHAKRSKAKLVIAKLDRLSRNVAFVSTLMEGAVDFVAVDNPNANRLTVHILAAVAEDEAHRISERTKAALAAYKRRGGLLGGARPECRNLTAKAAQRGRKASILARQANTIAAYADVAPTIAEFREAGLSLRAIAERLNADGHTTRLGAAWNPVQVSRVLASAS